MKSVISSMKSEMVRTDHMVQTCEAQLMKSVPKKVTVRVFRRKFMAATAEGSWSGSGAGSTAREREDQTVRQSRAAARGEQQDAGRAAARRTRSRQRCAAAPWQACEQQ
jgi:hypothetical protein